MLRSLTPGLNYLTKRYSRQWLRADSIAGLAVAAYLIPQVMACLLYTSDAADEL